NGFPGLCNASGGVAVLPPVEGIAIAAQPRLHTAPAGPDRRVGEAGIAARPLLDHVAKHLVRGARGMVTDGQAADAAGFGRIRTVGHDASTDSGSMGWPRSRRSSRSMAPDSQSRGR